MKKVSVKKVIEQFINATNKFDVEAALTLFSQDAVIDDVSVGQKFKNTSGVRDYIEKYFVNYNTLTKLESLKLINNDQAIAQVDFTGDFGHETGALDVTLDAKGLISSIDAHLD